MRTTNSAIHISELISQSVKPAYSRFFSGALAAAGMLLVCGQGHADERAQALLQRVAETQAQTQTLSADFTTQTVYATRYRDTQEKGTVVLARPGQARIEITRFRKPEDADVWKATGNGSSVIADGGATWTLIRHPHSAQVRQSPSNAAQTDKLLDGIDPLRGFFSGAVYSADRANYVGAKRWENADYEVVTIPGVNGEANASQREQPNRRSGTSAAAGETQLYIGRDNLIHRVVIRGQGKDQPTLREAALSHIQRNVPLPPAAFAFTPPPDAAPFKREAPGALLTAGAASPDFTVEDAAGRPVRLSDLRGKVVVLKFWATWCWSCKQSLPSTNDIARRYADKNVVVLAVDIWDSKKGFAAWLSRRQGYDYLRFAIDPKPQGQDVASTLYHVKATPTQYVIGKDGKVVAALEGYEGPSASLEAAIQSANAAPAQTASIRR